MRFPRLSPAQLQMSGDTPYSSEYEDKYYSEEDGLIESRFTFLEGNQLPENWQNKNHFTIAELGFGTGLNFFVTWQAWLQDPNRTETLTFVSLEQSPLNPQLLTNLAQRWPELSGLISEFLTQYPTQTLGHHWLSFENGAVNLLLCFGDAQAILPEWQLGVDAWYLDGFAPSRNPEMWSAHLCKAIARNTRIGASFATFTAASAVRRALIAAGFEIQKTEGFAGKRERLVGRFSPANPKQASEVPLPLTASELSSTKPQQFWIIGGGIAALSLAQALAEQGLAKQTHIIAAEKLSAASHNPAAVVLPQISSELTSRGYLHLQAYQYALGFYQKLQAEFSEVQPFFEEYPALKQLAHAENLAEQQKILANSLVAYQIPKDLADLTDQELHYQRCAVVNGHQLCHALQQRLLSSGVTWHDGELLSVDDQQLILSDSQRLGLAKNDSVIYCIGSGSLDFFAKQSQQANPLSCHMTRGQMNRLPATHESRNIRSLVSRDTYITAATDQYHYLGSTFNKSKLDDELSQTEAAQLDELWRDGLAHYPEEVQAIYSQLEMGQPTFAALRLHTADRMPMLGPLPNWNICQQLSDREIDKLRSSKPFFSRAAADYSQQNSWLFTGLGAHGFTLAPILAKSLAAMLTQQQPQILQKTLLRELHPLWHQLKSFDGS